MNNQTPEIIKLRELRTNKLIHRPNKTITRMTLTDLKNVLKTRYNITISVSYLSLIECEKRIITRTDILEALEHYFKTSREKLFPFYRGKEIIEQGGD